MILIYRGRWRYLHNLSGRVIFISGKRLFEQVIQMFSDIAHVIASIKLFDATTIYG